MKKILYSPGEPSGIGPDLIIQICSTPFWEKIHIPIVCLADKKLIQDRAKVLNKKIKIDILNNLDSANQNKFGVIQIKEVSKCRITKPGKLYKSNAAYVLKNLDYGIEQSIKEGIGLVTGPISKENIITIDEKFSGHTEYIQKKTLSNDVLMLLGSKKLRVAIATTHVPLKKVPKLITKRLIINKAMILHNELITKFKIKSPRIKLLGLNPHAGEGGKIGTEERNILIPAVKELRKNNINISMPLSADTAFTKKILADTDAYLGMYHDQVLPVIKALSFGNTINITLGVPIIRTSVDHGVALDIAGSGKTDVSSFEEAIRAAKKMI
ncbi:MAG: 4-hydroxythreonine-4-phosphate dehydrogenase PdxA [Flavobacteriales bacterium]|nr:4-hydroxythreonine-4-phosphate dehydrogenase PdxA [Flavobacteriales bacterium]